MTASCPICGDPTHGEGRCDLASDRMTTQYGIVYEWPSESGTTPKVVIETRTSKADAEAIIAIHQKLDPLINISLVVRTVEYGEWEKPARFDGDDEKPWPGYCQACGAALDPPNATACDTCHASDDDE